MALERKHYIGILTAGTIGLLWGGAQYGEGILPHWEGHDKARNIAIHQKFDPKGVVTVCSGITNYDIPGLKEGDVYTRVMCHDAEQAATPKYNDMLVSCLPKDFMVGEHQHAAMLAFVYNIGRGSPTDPRHPGFCYSAVGREFRAGHREAACRNMGNFVRAAGVVLNGLENRRYDKFIGEIAWCLRDD